VGTRLWRRAGALVHQLRRDAVRQHRLHLRHGEPARVVHLLPRAAQWPRNTRYSHVPARAAATPAAAMSPTWPIPLCVGRWADESHLLGSEPAGRERRRYGLSYRRGGALGSAPARACSRAAASRPAEKPRRPHPRATYALRCARAINRSRYPPIELGSTHPAARASSGDMIPPRKAPALCMSCGPSLAGPSPCAAEA
jgi:hypothetical protein